MYPCIVDDERSCSYCGHCGERGEICFTCPNWIQCDLTKTKPWGKSQTTVLAFPEVGICSISNTFTRGDTICEIH